MSERKINTYSSSYPFPKTPNNWDQEGKQFAQGLQNLFDQIFGTTILRKAYPVGIVVLTGANQAPFSFGKWTSVSTGISGVYGWKRTA